MAEALATPGHVEADVVLFDESRVSCRQIMLVQLHACSKHVCCCLQEMPDRMGVLSPAAAVANVRAVTSPKSLAKAPASKKPSAKAAAKPKKP
eukprot:3733255-Alexandrium_andersonii.AAC.1